MAEHLNHVAPQLNYTPAKPIWDHSTLRDLDDLNFWNKGRYVFLTSNDDVETNPDWLGGGKNIPEPYECGASKSTLEHVDVTGSWRQVGSPWLDDIDLISRRDAGGKHFKSHAADTTRPDEDDEDDDNDNDDVGGGGGISDNSLGYKEGRSTWTDQTPITGPVQSCTGGRSDAPAVLIVVDKGNGVVDAFWFYFYSYNLGNEVFGVRFGNHVGDWEHSLVRFHNGTPKAVYLSEHSFGEAYSYDAIEKIGRRPVVYSAEGTHAMYATPGTHAYVLPWGILHDETDRGPIWDPALNALTFTYDTNGDTLRASNVTPDAPTQWFYFAGHWGDKRYPLDDERQYRLAGQYHYVNGPLGPRFKNLGRSKVCQTPTDDRPCVIREHIEEDVAPRRWTYVGDGEEMSEADYNRFLAD